MFNCDKVRRSFLLATTKEMFESSHNCRRYRKYKVAKFIAHRVYSNINFRPLSAYDGNDERWTVLLREHWSGVYYAK